jgi:hypothetical protein
LITRRAKTTLELRDGQSFALAGLLDNREQVNLSKVPLLGDVPIIGELFKSRRFQRNETELMFLATVKIVEPLNPDQVPRLPGVSELKPVGSTNPAGATPSSAIEGQSGHSTPATPATTTPPPAPAPQQKSGAGALEGDNKTQTEQPAAGKVENGAGASLTSAVVGPVGADIGVQKTVAAPATKPEAKPEVKEQKSPPQGSDKP